jgi:hypothetical protein
MKGMSDASDASRVRQRRITFVTTTICLLGAAVSIALLVTGHGTRGTALLLAGEAIGFAGGVYNLWITGKRAKGPFLFTPAERLALHSERLTRAERRSLKRALRICTAPGFHPLRLTDSQAALLHRYDTAMAERGRLSRWMDGAR